MFELAEEVKMRLKNKTKKVDNSTELDIIDLQRKLGYGSTLWHNYVEELPPKT